jgi:hypothetical protein
LKASSSYARRVGDLIPEERASKWRCRPSRSGRSDRDVCWRSTAASETAGYRETGERVIRKYLFWRSEIPR